jgi:hypothetical protein
MMEDYPRTILELEQRFATDEACRDYLFQLRWPEGFVCPRCAGQSAWEASRGRLVCRSCRHQTSVTAGTVFQDTRNTVVSGHLAGHESEERGQRCWSSTSLGLTELPNRVDLVAQTPSCDDTSGPRQAERTCRSR